MDHPDPTGPETAEEPTAAHDGQPNGGNGGSISEQADEPEAPQPPPITADVPGGQQQTLAGMPRRKVPTRHTIVVQQRSFDVAGPLDPTKEGKLLLTYRYAKETRIPKIVLGEVVDLEIRHQVVPVHGMRPEQWEGWVSEITAFHDTEPGD